MALALANPVVVLDASAAIRVVLSPAEHGGWIELLQAASDVVAPQLFASEVANTLWKYQRAGQLSADDAAIRLDEAFALVSVWEDDRDLLQMALKRAAEYSHPVYDCLYLECAERHAGAELLSADKRMNALHLQHFGS